jgi:hypothetical protein
VAGSLAAAVVVAGAWLTWVNLPTVALTWLVLVG